MDKRGLRSSGVMAWARAHPWRAAGRLLWILLAAAWREWMTFRVTPREPVYDGPVVIIMNTLTFSSAEQFLVSLVDSGRVLTVGRATGGGSGNPTVFRLPGERDVRFSTANFVRNDGTPIEGVGLTPDVPVSWTVADMRQGRDPDLEAAERLVLERE